MFRKKILKHLHCTNHCDSTYHVLWVNKGVVNGHDLDAFLKTSPQDQAADTPEAGTGRKMKHIHFGKMVGNILRKSHWPRNLECHFGPVSTLSEATDRDVISVIYLY